MLLTVVATQLKLNHGTWPVSARALIQHWLEAKDMEPRYYMMYAGFERETLLSDRRFDGETQMYHFMREEGTIRIYNILRNGRPATYSKVTKQSGVEM
jgi:hypothetical protein